MTVSKSELVFEPLPSDDPTRRSPDIARARERIGWEPVTPLRPGLEKTIAYFDDALRRQSLPGGA